MRIPGADPTDIRNTREPVRPWLSAIETVILWSPTGRSTFWADRLLAVLVACSNNRAVMSMPIRVGVSGRIRKARIRKRGTISKASRPAGTESSHLGSLQRRVTNELFRGWASIAPAGRSSHPSSSQFCSRLIVSKLNFALVD